MRVVVSGPKHCTGGTRGCRSDLLQPTLRACQALPSSTRGARVGTGLFAGRLIKFTLCPAKTGALGNQAASRKCVIYVSIA